MSGIHTHLDSPNAGPSPDIQDALRMRGDWRQIPLASQADLDQFVHYIEPITLFLAACQHDGGFKAAMQLPRHWDRGNLDERVSLCCLTRHVRRRTSFLVCVISPAILMLIVGDIVG